LLNNSKKNSGDFKPFAQSLNQIGSLIKKNNTSTTEAEDSVFWGYKQ
jgi:hypothetical protein